MPWFKPITIIANTNTNRLITPYEAIAISPPYDLNWLFSMMITKQCAMFIRNGDKPIASARLVIVASNRQMPRWKWMISFGFMKIVICHITAIACDRTVANAAPRTPISRPKIKIGSSTILMNTATIVATIDVRG